MGKFLKNEPIYTDHGEGRFFEYLPIKGMVRIICFLHKDMRDMRGWPMLWEERKISDVHKDKRR